MNGKFLLDTNIIIGVFAKDLTIHKRMIIASEVFAPSVAIGELYYGAYKSAQKQKNIECIAAFVHDNTILQIGAETARIYGDIKNRLKSIGKPIPENDIWIAATAQQFDIVLATRDTHFSVIDDIDIEIW